MNLPDIEETIIVKLLRNPSDAIGKQFFHNWEQGTQEVWYTGRVNEICDGEMCIEYEDNEENFFMTHAEFLTDIHLGDMSFTV